MEYLIIAVLLIALFLVTLRKEEKQIVMSYSPITVATYFLEKDQCTTITPMKLIKLVYIAHGWYMALKNGDALINEKAEAWKYGPVIPSLYDRFRNYGSNVINNKPHIDTSVISKEDKKILDDVWNSYGNKSGIQLSGKTHEPNTPWSKIWEKAKETTRKEDLIIPNELIMQHYENLLLF